MFLGIIFHFFNFKMLFKLHSFIWIYSISDFAKESKILLINFVRILKIISNAAKTFDILATILSILVIMIVQQNIFLIYIQPILNISTNSFFLSSKFL